MTAMCNSSLATVPVTLQCLHRMNVSAHRRAWQPVSARITTTASHLYEAMVALFRSGAGV